MDDQDHQTGKIVRRRRVIYIPGYDPVPPRRYRERYRREGLKQAAISGYEIGLTAHPVVDDAPYGWHVTTQIDGVQTQADVEVLIWSDIVQGSMQHGIMATYLQLAHTAWTYISTGALFRLMRLRKGPVIAALYPVAMLLGQLLVALLLIWSVATLCQWLGAQIALGSDLLIIGISWGVGLATGNALLRWFKSLDSRFLAYYLMHDYSFSARFGGANPPELEERMALFADHIGRALQDTDLDEVLVVGHSSGAHLAISVLSDLLRGDRMPKGGPELSFLSLGQVVPMVSFLPKAYRLRADLAYLSASDQITWVDVTAPGDGCAFALCDPVSVSGVAPPNKRWPLVFSAAFSQTLSPAAWSALKWRLFEVHFQYLNAFDRPRDYDYFQITAGPETLADRYRGRAPSKSRIETPVNRYQSVA
jgi:hypothetical protein